MEEDKKAHTFTEGIWLNVNVIERLVFEYAHYNVTIQYVRPSTMGIPPSLPLSLQTEIKRERERERERGMIYRWSN